MQKKERIENLVNKYVEQATSILLQNQGIFRFTQYGDLSIEHHNLLALLYKLCYDKFGIENINKFHIDFSYYQFYSDILTTEEWNELIAELPMVTEIAFSSRWMLEHADFSATPKEIIDLMLLVADVSDGENIYNPFAGWNSIAIKKPACNVIGEEINERTWKIGQLNLLLSGNKALIKNADSFSDECIKTYDNIITCPPFAQRGFEEYVRKLYDLLAQNGKMVFLIEPGFLFAAHNRLWDYLIEQKSVAMVVQLPENVLPNTQIAPCVVFLEKKTHESICMADFSFAHKPFSAKSRLQVLDIDAIKHTLESADTYEELLNSIIKNVPYEKYNRELGVYPIPYMIEVEDGTRLGDLVVSLRKYEDVSSVDTILKIRPADLSATYPLSPVVSHSEENTQKSVRYVRVPSHSILVATNNNGLLVGYAGELGDAPVYAPHTISVLEPKNVSIPYLLMLLLQPSVVKQFMSLNTFNRGIIHRIPEAALLKISLPNIPEIEIAERIEKAKFDSMSVSERKLLEEYRNFESSVHMRKHAISQNLSAIASLLNSFKRCFDRNKGVLSADIRINQISEFTVQSALTFLVEQMGVVSQQVEDLTEVEYKFEEATDIDLQRFTDEYFAANIPLNFTVINQIVNQYQETIEVEHPDYGLARIEKGDPITTVKFPKDALQMIYKNVVSNAIDYGFIESTCLDYKVLVSMLTDGSNVQLEISNNGTPINETVEMSRILDSGYSTKLNQDGHQGRGCADIAEIMKRHGGKVEVISTPDEEFTVTYRLTFTDTNIVDL